MPQKERIFFQASILFEGGLFYISGGGGKFCFIDSNKALLLIKIYAKNTWILGVLYRQENLFEMVVWLRFTMVKSKKTPLKNPSKWPWKKVILCVKLELFWIKDARTNSCEQWSKPIRDIPWENWLVHGDPYDGSFQSLYTWVVFDPPYDPTNRGEIITAPLCFFFKTELKHLSPYIMVSYNPTNNWAVFHPLPLDLKTHVKWRFSAFKIWVITPKNEGNVDSQWYIRRL